MIIKLKNHSYEVYSSSDLLGIIENDGDNYGWYFNPKDCLIKKDNFIKIAKFMDTLK